MFAMDSDYTESVNLDNVISIRWNKRIVEAQAVNGRWIVLGNYKDEETAKNMFFMLCEKTIGGKSVLMDDTVEGDEDDE